MVKVILDNTKKMYGLSEKQLKKVKDDLTLINPKYIQTKKHSKNKRIFIDKYLFLYKLHSNCVEVPQGYILPFNDKIIEEDNRIENTVLYKPFKISLRNTQRVAFKKYINNTDNGMIILPTGKGKSILGLCIASRLRQKTLVIVHKDDLVSGWKEDIKIAFNSKIKSGLIKAKKRTIGKQITIATIQTLNRLDKEELDKLYNTFGLVIVDECHHTPSSSYKILNNFRACYKVGLTATAERKDGLSKLMSLYLGGIAYKHPVEKEDKDILPVQVIIKDSGVKYVPYYKLVKNKWVECSSKEKRSVCITKIPYKKRPRINFLELDNKLVTHPKYMSLITTDIVKEYKEGRSIIVFFRQKKHVDLYYDILKDLGISDKVQKYYGNSKEPKDIMKLKAENKDVLITLATYSIATEGTNVKAWEVAFLVGSLNDGKNVEQAIGRIRRIKEGKINPVRVYDYTNNMYILNNHINTRKIRYRKLKFNIIGDKLFSRGFNR